MLVLWVICTIAWAQVGIMADVGGNIPGEAGTHDESLNQHAEVQKNDPPPSATNFKDCADLYPLLYWTNAVHDGVFSIKPESNTGHFDVFCDMTTDGGGWTVIQKRFNGRVNFDRRWEDYKIGFGNVEGEHWLGLDKIHNLISQADYELYVELGDWEDNLSYAKYDTFSIEDESTDYTLHVGGYSGDAGDQMVHDDGMKFSARNRDNDADGRNCAQLLSGGWWYPSCSGSALNGAYFQIGDYNGINTGTGVFWGSLTGWGYSLKTTKIMVRPRNYIRSL